MKNNWKFLILFKVVLLLAACAQLQERIFDLPVGSDMLDAVSIETKSLSLDLPHHLNSFFIDDLSQFTDAPLYTLDIFLNQ